MKKLILLTTIFSISTLEFFAQSFGIESDNFGGINSVIFNPANVVDSRLRLESNLFSANALIGNDYVGITLDNVTKAFKDDFKFGKDLERFPKAGNNFTTELDVLGPSSMFNINKNNSLALVTRIRSYVNINNISGELLEQVLEDFESETLSNLYFDNELLNINSNVWAELGVTYGRVLLNKEQHFLKGGLTFKYLVGAGFAQAFSKTLKGDFNESQNTLTTTGSLSYSTTIDEEGEEDEKYNFSTKNNGYGGDIGFVYEWRPDFEEFDENQDNYKGLNKYKLKVGIAITDIGAITYKDITSTAYDLNNTVNVDVFDDNDFKDVLDNNYSNTKSISDVKVKLPSTLRFNADYNIAKRFYASLNYTHSLNDKDRVLANRTINTISLIPRFESKWISCYLPVSFNEYKGTNVGVGFRLGVLMVGSGTIISNLISKEAKSLNVYAGLKIPIYQKSKIKN